jgi:hypothetical protein
MHNKLVKIAGIYFQEINNELYIDTIHLAQILQINHSHFVHAINVFFNKLSGPSGDWDDFWIDDQKSLKVIKAESKSTTGEEEDKYYILTARQALFIINNPVYEYRNNGRFTTFRINIINDLLSIAPVESKKKTSKAKA